MGDAADEFDRVFGGVDLARELQERNQQLLAVLDAKNEEILQLRELAEAAAELSSGDPHAQKIVQLSKKNRTLGLALEKERSLSQQLAGELRTAKASATKAIGAASGTAAEEAARAIVQEAAEAAEAAQREADSWKEKFQQTADRSIQAEAKMAMMKKEMEKMQRALQREIGEGVELGKVLADDGGGWRGRAQQISLLKDKLREAQRAGRTRTRTGNTWRTSKDKRAKEAERVAAEAEELRQELDKLRLKCDGATSRKKTLENEAKGLKDKLAILLQKTTNDDKLIGALRAEVADARRTQGKADRQPGSAVQLQQTIMELRQQLAAQGAQIQRQEMIIQTLQAGVTG
eukprot:jgi/Tetstr1/456792/TSEL_043466.t1